MPYRAPVSEFQFLYAHVVGLAQVSGTALFGDASADTAQAILAEAGRLCEETLAPLNRAGDTHPARLENGVVRTAPGFAEGYRAIAQGGWVGMTASPDHGGMGLPVAVATTSTLPMIDHASATVNRMQIDNISQRSPGLGGFSMISSAAGRNSWSLRGRALTSASSWNRHEARNTSRWRASVGQRAARRSDSLTA